MEDMTFVHKNDKKNIAATSCKISGHGICLNVSSFLLV